MPKPSVEQQQSHVETIKKTLANKGEKLEQGPLRDLKKRLRRAQRKHSRLTVEAERRAKVSQAKKKEEVAPEPAS